MAVGNHGALHRTAGQARTSSGASWEILDVEVLTCEQGQGVDATSGFFPCGCLGHG